MDGSRWTMGLSRRWSIVEFIGEGWLIVLFCEWHFFELNLKRVFHHELPLPKTYSLWVVWWLHSMNWCLHHFIRWHWKFIGLYPYRVTSWNRSNTLIMVLQLSFHFWVDQTSRFLFLELLLYSWQISFFFLCHELPIWVDVGHFSLDCQFEFPVKIVFLWQDHISVNPSFSEPPMEHLHISIPIIIILLGILFVIWFLNLTKLAVVKLAKNPFLFSWRN